MSSTRALALALSLTTIALACGGSDSNTPVDPPPEESAVLFLVEFPQALNPSEAAIRDRLTALGLEVEIRADAGFAADDAQGFELVAISKTVRSSSIGSKLRDFEGGVIFWEDNLQQLSMFSTISNDGSEGTIWHDRGTRIRVLPTAPAELRAGLSGEVEFYTTRDEIIVAPSAEIVGSAIVVAEVAETGNKAIYVLEPGALLANGSRTGGRRVLFGLYNDTYTILTPEGRALFDAAVRWAARL